MASFRAIELRVEASCAEEPWPIAKPEISVPADRLVPPNLSDCWLKASAPSNGGSAFVLGDQPTSFKAVMLVLQPDMPAAETFRAIVRACVQHFRLNELLLVANRSAESLHQARVAIRRLRSALSLFESIAEDQEYEGLKRRLRDVSYRLGKARNLDVYIASNTPLDTGGKADLLPLDPDLAIRVHAARKRAYQRVLWTLRSNGFRELMQDLVAWLEGGAWRTREEPERQAARDQPIEDFAARILERRRRKLRQGGRHLERLSSEGRHRVRIEAKKLRYASEFFSSLSPDRKHRARHASFLAALEELQTALGGLNDIETGREIAAEFAPPEPAPAGGSRGAGRTRDHLCQQESPTTALVRSACKAHRRLSDAKPFWKSA